MSVARRLELGRVGETVERVDAVPKVTGEFAYSSDLVAPGMLWGHTVRSPHAHAWVRAIDNVGNAAASVSVYPLVCDCSRMVPSLTVPSATFRTAFALM